ncbi:MAG: hypothetical protein ACT4N9_04470 [Paracoccaceae bacterium]
MFRALRIVLILVLAGALVLIGFAYFGDLSPQRQDVRQPVTLNGG